MKYLPKQCPDCMYVRHAYEPGELILVERPLFVIVPDNDRELWAKLNSLNEQHPLQLSPIWHQAAFLTIVTGTAEQIEIMKGKWVLGMLRSYFGGVFCTFPCGHSCIL